MFIKKYFPLLFVFIFNLWVWRIFKSNLLIGLLIVATTLLLFTLVNYKKKTKWNAALYFCYLLLIFIQYKTSSINSLTFLNERERSIQIERMHGYPPKLYRVSNWLEARPEALIYYKLVENIREVVDPNLYFFANHPRERVGIVEYEKFAYIFLPFFVIGTFSQKEKKKLKYLFLSLSPLALIAFIGNSNPLGPLSLFPFLAVNTAVGLKPIFEDKRNLLIFTVIFGLVFSQTFAYATY